MNDKVTTLSSVPSTFFCYHHSVTTTVNLTRNKFDSTLLEMGDPKYSLQLSRKAPGGGPKYKTILRSKSVPVSVYHNNKNVTPKSLNPDIIGLTKERQLGVYDTSSITPGISTMAIQASGKEPEQSQRSTPGTSLRFRTDVRSSGFGESIFGDNFGNFEPTMIGDLLDIVSSTSTVKSESDLDVEQEEEVREVRKAPTHVSLTLSETNTYIILDMPSCTEIKDTEEGNLVEAKNEEYEYLTEGRGKNRKVVHAEAQTIHILKKCRTTAAEVVNQKNSSAFASNWEMYDTYHEKAEAKVTSDTEDEDQDETCDLNKLVSVDSIESFRVSADEKQLARLCKNPRFLEACCVIERLLANNVFYEEQKIFRGLIENDYFRENVEYNYRLRRLWTFANTTTKGRCVTCLQWNPANQDLLAVGYGKFQFAENTTGIVMVWNIKNPVQPERTYNFPDPVTSLNFSVKDPNLLAIGFYNGFLAVLNITNRETHIMAENVPTFEVIWYVQWRPNPDVTKDREQIVTTSDDGRVLVYTLENRKILQFQQIMRVAKADGKLKGMAAMMKCSNLNIPVSRYAGARILKWHPNDPTIYLVATNEGVVHKCSTNYLNQHLDLFLAHEGPVNQLIFNPFIKQLYATCGDDYYIRIWIEGISEPIYEQSYTMQSVQDLDFSPTNSTILASIHGKMILIWDFQRKDYLPQSETISPTNCRNTIVEFTSSGRCLVVGDVDGHVHVFSLEDMPFPVYFQENLLYQALMRNLATKPHLINKLKKMKKQGLFEDDKHDASDID